MIRLVAGLAFLAAPALSQAQAVDTLKKIRDSKTVAIADRTDALPYSFEGNKQPAADTVELCNRVAATSRQRTNAAPSPALIVVYGPGSFAG